MAKCNSFRIIGGRWRSRRLTFPNVDSLRPTLDRVRETVFNWLAPEIPGSVVLDAYAGSGSLGLEALSRGAHRAIFVDVEQVVCTSIAENARRLGVEEQSEEVLIECGCVLRFLNDQSVGIRFDVVFLDPPFHRDLLEPTLAALITHDRLAEGALIYAEMESSCEVPVHDSLKILKAKSFGSIKAILWRWR